MMDVRARLDHVFSVTVERSRMIGRRIARSSSALFTPARPATTRFSIIPVGSRDQLRVMAVALASVVAAALIRYLVGANEAAAAFILMSAVVGV